MATISIQITATNDASEQLTALSASLDTVQASADATTESIATADQSFADFGMTVTGTGYSVDEFNALMDEMGVSADTTAASVDAAAASTDTLAASSDAAGFSMSGLNSALGAFGITALGMTAVEGLASNLNAVGVASERANLALDTLSQGHADQYLDAMRKSTGGLVDDMTLAAAASKGLSTGIADTAAQMAEITRIGTILGDTFDGSATTGISDFERVLEMVGSSRGLKQLNIDSDAVMSEYKDLVAQGIDKAVAWRMAVEDVAGTLANKLGPAITDGVGSQVDKLGVKWKNFTDQMAENFATGANAILDMMDKIHSHDVTPTLLEQANNSFAFVANIVNPVLQNARTAAQIGASGSSGGQVDLNFEDPNLQSYLRQGNPATSVITNPRNNWNNGSILPGMGQSGYDLSGGQYYQNGQASMGVTGADMGNANDNMLIGGMDFSEAQLAAGAQQADQMTKAKGLLQDLSLGVQSYAYGWQQALAPIQAASAELDRQSKLQSVNEAFGIGKASGFTTETTGEMDKGVAAARQALIAKDQQTWKGKQGEANDLAIFDAQSKEAMDAYMIATGQATQQSIAFKDQQSELSGLFDKGKISVAQYASAMLELANNAASGVDSLEKIEQLEMASASPKQRTAMAHVNRVNETLDKGDQALKTSTDTGDPYGLGVITLDAGKADTAIQRMKSDTFDWQGAFQTATSSIQKNVQTIIGDSGLGAIPGSARNATKAISTIYDQLQAIAGTLVVQIGFNKIDTNSDTRSTPGAF